MTTPILCMTGMEFGVSWDASHCPWHFVPRVTNCIPTSITFKTLYIKHHSYYVKQSYFIHDLQYCDYPTGMSLLTER